MYLKQVRSYAMAIRSGIRIFLLVYTYLSSLLAVDLNNVSNHQTTLIKEIQADLVEITIPETGQKIYKRTSGPSNTESTSEVPELVLQIEDINFGDYEDHYTFWHEVELWHPHQMIITDTDQDGDAELLGMRTYTHKTVPDGDTLWFDVLYELSNDSGFVEVHKYPFSTNMPWWSGDLDRDGNMEVLVNKTFLSEQYNATVRTIQCFESPSPSAFATEHNFDVPLTRLTQANDVTIHDLDQDGQLDMLYYLDMGVADVEPCPAATHIAEYDRATNSFVEKFCFQQPSDFTAHYAVGDFDSDGKTEFATAGIEGELYVFEATGDDTYNLIWEDTLDTYNAYMSTTTNDINWNGKPELWVGGDIGWGPERDVPETRIFCLESNGNNSFEIIYKITIPGIFSFDGCGVDATDINQDGTDELMIWVVDHIFILEGTGSLPSEVIYAVKNTKWGSPLFEEFLSATSKDLDSDGYPELLISMEEGQDYTLRNFTRIYRPSGPLLSIEPVEQPDVLRLIKAYPNPFNSHINIAWNENLVPVTKVSVYSIDGRQIVDKSVLNGTDMKEGYFQWDGKTANGEEVNSGTYIVLLEAGKHSETVKVTLMK